MSYYTPYNIDLNETSKKGEAGFYSYISKTLAIPESLQNILTDISTAEFIEEDMGPKFNLSDQQKNNLARIIRDILLADLFIGDFTLEIQSKLQTDQQKAKEMGNYITANLFAPALDDLKILQRQRFRDKIKTSQTNLEQKKEIDPIIASQRTTKTYEKFSGPPVNLPRTDQRLKTNDRRPPYPPFNKIQGGQAQGKQDLSEEQQREGGSPQEENRQDVNVNRNNVLNLRDK